MEKKVMDDLEYERRQIVAVDVDGCILKYESFKGVDSFGVPLPGAVESLQAFRLLGWYIIVWTCRPNVDALRQHLDKHEIPFDSINENCPDVTFETSGKVYADVYLDDRGYCFNGEWTPDLVLEVVQQLPHYRRGGATVAGLGVLESPEGYDDERHYLEIQESVYALRNEKVTKYGKAAYSVAPGWAYNFYMRFSDLRRKFVRFEEAIRVMLRGEGLPDIEQCIEDANDLTNYAMLMRQVAELHRRYNDDGTKKENE